MKEIYKLKVRDERRNEKGVRHSFEVIDGADGFDPMLILSATPGNERPDLKPGQLIKLTIETISE
jgi:hypothetical protein